MFIRCKCTNFPIFKSSKNIPISKDKYKSSAMQTKKNVLNFLSKKTGTPKGLIDFLMLSSSIIFSTSAGPAGER